MKKALRPALFISLFLSLFLSSTGCMKRVDNGGRAQVELKWKLHTETHTNQGWVIAYGWVINRGNKRADWVNVTIYTMHEDTGVVLQKKSVYIDGTGPNGKSLEPGADARFEVRLDSKNMQSHRFETGITWSEAL